MRGVLNPEHHTAVQAWLQNSEEWYDIQHGITLFDTYCGRDVYCRLFVRGTQYVRIDLCVMGCGTLITCITVRHKENYLVYLCVRGLWSNSYNSLYQSPSRALP